MSHYGTIELGEFTDQEPPEIVYVQLWPTSGQRWPVGNSQFAPAS